MTGSRSIHNLALIGFMGSGKSSVGRLCAQLLGFDFLDTDTLIEQQANQSISRIFQQQGEPVFRQWEQRIVQALVQCRKSVIATGGGLPINPANLQSLRTHALVVCLWTSPETLFERVSRTSHRPLLQDPDPMQKIRTLLAARAPFYRQADVLVNTEQRTLQEVAAQVVHQFHQARAAHA